MRSQTVTEYRGTRSRRFVESLGQWLLWPVPPVLLFLALWGCDASTVEEKTSPEVAIVIVEVTPTPTITPSPTKTPTPTRMSGAGSVEEAEARWQASGITDYRIKIHETHSVWCWYEVNLEVQQGQVVTGTVTAHRGPADDCRHYVNRIVGAPVGLSPTSGSRWTVPGLFEIARGWRAEAAEENLRILVEFNPKLGYPTLLRRDRAAALDDEISLEIWQFEPLRP